MLRSLILAAALACLADPAAAEARKRFEPYTGPDRSRPAAGGREHDWTGTYVGVSGGYVRSGAAREGADPRDRRTSPFPEGRP